MFIGRMGCQGSVLGLLRIMYVNCLILSDIISCEETGSAAAGMVQN